MERSHSIQNSLIEGQDAPKGSGRLKHRIRLWAALRWTALILAILFVIGYVGILMLMPGLHILTVAYPDPLPQIGFFIHAFPGSVWVVFGGLQFFAYIRSRSPIAHRVIGYMAVCTVPISVAGGFVIIASGKTEGGHSMQIFGTLFFVIWVLSCFMGWYYMRYQKNTKKHREWMIRAYVISYAIILMRPGVFLYFLIFPDTTSTGKALANVGPLTWILALLLIEYYIRRERANQVDVGRHYIAVPATGSSEEDGLIRVTNYQENFVRVKLVQKQDLNHSTALFVFELPENAQLFSFPCHHVTLRQKVTGVICRHYSPVTEFTRYFGQQGAVALAIKRYPQGEMSRWIHDSLKIGETVEMMGPSGSFYYSPNQYDSIGLIAGGTGITPFLSLIISVLTNRRDQTRIQLLYVASTDQDFIFKNELEQLSRQYANSFEVKFLAGRGVVARSVLSEFLPGPSDSTLIGLCGPIGFCSAMQKTLAKRKYKEHMIYTFGESNY